MFFWPIFIALLSLNLWWWYWSAPRLDYLPGGKWLRKAMGAWLLAFLSMPFWFLLTIAMRRSFRPPMPAWFMSAVYLWGLLILPMTAVIVYGVTGLRWLAVRVGLLRDARRRKNAAGLGRSNGGRVMGAVDRLGEDRVMVRGADPTGTNENTGATATAAPVSVSAPALAMPTRRRLLACAVAGLPPIALAGAVGVSVSQIGEFRIKPVTLAPAGWPADLDGFTIAIVADLHTGFFSTTQMLRDVRDATNNLRTDLILLTGDLVNLSLSDLSSGLEMVLGLDAPCGVYMCEGNHDLMQSPPLFVQRVDASGVPLLRDTDAIIRKRGKTPIQLWGLCWSDHGQDGLDESIARIAPMRDPSLFPILMAHHPHAWDPAAAAGFPLVLSGHTHGGQIMLTQSIGAGPLRFRYWSGVYRRPGSTLLISNGVGNWFPLRVNAPAEIVHLTLRAGGTA